MSDTFGLNGGKSWLESALERARPWRYAIALGLVAAATVLRWILDPMLGSGLPFMTFYPAVALVAMLAGGRAGLVATALSALLANWFFLEPRNSLALRSANEVFALSFFSAAGVLISLTGGMLALTRERLARDITGRRRAEEELRRRAEELERLNQIASTYVNSGKLDEVLGCILEAAIAISGADFGNIQIADSGTSELRIVAQRGFPQGWLDFWNQADRGQGACGRALSRGERVVIEDIEQSPVFIGTPALEVQLKAGVRAVQSTPLVSPSGKLVGIFSTHYKIVRRPEERALKLLDLLARQAADLIERAQWEQTLAAKEAELQLILENTPFMLTRCSRDLRYRFASRAYAEMLGRTSAEMAAKSIVEIMGEKGFETIRPHVDRVLRGERVEYEAPIDFARVGVRHLQVIYVPEWDEQHNVAGWIASIIDLSRQQRAETALKLSEERFRIFMDNSPAIAWIKGESGHYTYVSKSYEKRFGMNLADIQGKTDAELWGALGEPFRENDLKALAANQPLEVVEEAVDREGRHSFWLNGKFPFLDASGGRFVGGVGIDITERKATQAELERLVAERTAKLQELVRELEHFSYTITHDMRAPLRAMRAFAEVLKEACEERLGEEEKMFVGRIITAAERMDVLIADALNYSKAVRQELALAPVQVGTLLRGMLDTYPEFHSTRADIHLDRDLPIVMGNEAGLTQCFSNLLGNAIKFVAPGTKPNVRVWGEPRDGRVRLWVEDNGIGISETMRPRVFDMFSRGSSPQAGTGIGLALVRKVVERMGGEAGVESESGKGSRFWMELNSGSVRHEVGIG